MKYNIAIKNAKVEGVAQIEELNIQVEYSVGEIPEILGHVLPFVERLAGEVIPKVIDKVVEAKARVYAIEAEDDARRDAAREKAERELEAHWSGENLRQRAAKAHGDTLADDLDDVFDDVFGESIQQIVKERQVMQDQLGQLDKMGAPKEPDNTIGESLGDILRRRLQSQIDNDRAHRSLGQRWMDSGE